MLKLFKSHISPKCFLFCPFQQILQMYFQYLSMIYIIYMKFTKNSCRLWKRQIWRKSWKKLGSAEQWWANIIKWTRTNIRIYSDATLCTEWISEYIWMQHIYRTNIRIYLYPRNSTNRNTNNIWGSFYSNIRIFVLITDWRNFSKALTNVSSK